ncbi:MAG: lysophospholipid acyltransferase family protein [Pyrinomonadaceae bacterium]|jgi:hypothetical protein|nr:lysophospholipid acyltransferase family protein [Pyrinomonadaceae bacterium]
MSKINTKNSPIYQFANLSKYSFGKRLTIYLVDLILFGLITLIGKTVRFEFETWKNFEIDEWKDFETTYQKKSPLIAVFWHNRIFLFSYLVSKIWTNLDFVAMVSQSFDGEYISRAAQRLGYGIVRGSSSRGGLNASKEMLELLDQNLMMALTVDGPRGPKYKMKAGAIKLAKLSGCPIIVTIIECKSFWTLNSWDNLQIPKPFTKAKVFVSQPIFVSTETDEKEMADKLEEVQKRLDELVKQGENWRNGKI